jgi:outer membrane protein assembly factor BamB
MDRRDALRLGAGTVTAALAGCSALEGVLDGGNGGGTAGWSTFRGDPARSGVRPASAGPGESLSVAWQATSRDLVEEFHDVDPEEAGVIQGEASWPVLAGEHAVWTHGYRGLREPDPTVRVVAADPEDGSVAWSVEPPVPDGTALNWFAPEVDDGRLYVPASINDGLGLAVYDPATGEEQDRLDLGLPFLSGQPLVADGTVYVRESGQEGATLRAFDAGDGTERWAVGATPPEPGWPGLSVADGAVWTFDRRDGRAFVARETTDGDIRLRTPLSDLPTSFATNRPVSLAPPTVVDGGVYAAGGVQYLLQQDFAPLVAAEAGGGERWRSFPPGAEGALEVVLRDADPETLERLREELGLEDGYGTLYGHPIVVDGLVCAAGIGDAGDEPSGLFAFDAAEGSLEWAAPLPSSTFAPVAAGDVLYAVASEGVTAISGDGERLDTLSLADPRVEYSPALGAGRLFVTTLRGVAAVE